MLRVAVPGHHSSVTYRHPLPPVCSNNQLPSPAVFSPSLHLSGEAAVDVCQLARQEDQPSVREAPQVFGLPPGAHDAGRGVGVGPEQEVADLVRGDMPEEIAELPIGVDGKILHPNRIETGEGAGAVLQSGEAGGTGFGLVRAGRQLKHQAGGSQRPGAIGEVEGLARALAVHPVQRDTGGEEDPRGFGFHGFHGFSPETGEVVEGDSDLGLGLDGYRCEQQGEEPVEGVPHGPMLGPGGAYLHSAEVAKRSKGLTADITS